MAGIHQSIPDREQHNTRKVVHRIRVRARRTSTQQTIMPRRYDRSVKKLIQVTELLFIMMFFEGISLGRSK